LLKSVTSSNHERVVIDLEVAIHKAVGNVWPNITAVGCKFHLAQCWFRKIQTFGRYCYDLNFAVNRKGENVLEHSRTGSRTPTSGTGRVKSARGGEKDIKVEPTP
jgi:hypothetical protein